MPTEVKLEGFTSIAEARAAAMTFLRETRPKKDSGPRRTYANSYEHTRAQSNETQRN